MELNWMTWNAIQFDGRSFKSQALPHLVVAVLGARCNGVVWICDGVWREVKGRSRSNRGGWVQETSRIPFVILTGITIQLLCHVNIYIWGSGIDNSAQWNWLWPREGSSVCEISSVLFRWNVDSCFIVMYPKLQNWCILEIERQFKVLKYLGLV